MTMGLNVLKNAMNSNDETGTKRALDVVRDLWEQSGKTAQDREYVPCHETRPFILYCRWCIALCSC